MEIGGHLYAMTTLPLRISTGNHCIVCHVTSRAVDRTPIPRSPNLQIMQYSYVLRAGFTVTVNIIRMPIQKLCFSYVTYE